MCMYVRNYIRYILFNSLRYNIYSVRSICVIDCTGEVRVQGFFKYLKQLK